MGRLIAGLSYAFLHLIFGLDISCKEAFFLARNNNQKLKLLYLYQILLEKTDDTHSIGTQQIIDELDSKGISAERKSIYTDIKALTEYGADIIGEKKGRGYEYHLGNRQFELAELKLLVDAVQSSRFITRRKLKELIRKIEGLTSIYQEKELRHGGAYYRVSPWGVCWNDEWYYLIAFDDKTQEIRHYRVDKMKKLTLTGDKREGKDCFDSLDMAVYMKKRFGMYDGKEERVHLICKNDYAGVIIDRFGKNIPFSKVDDEHFEVTVNVAVSGLFFGWIIGLGDGVYISGPPKVVDMMKEEIKRLNAAYGI